MTNAPIDGWESGSTAWTATGSTATSAANPQPDGRDQADGLRAGSGSRNAAPMKTSALPTLAQLSLAARARRERRALRRDPYGLRPTVTEVDPFGR